MVINPSIYGFESWPYHGDIHAFGVGASSTGLCFGPTDLGHFVVYFLDGARR